MNAVAWFVLGILAVGIVLTMFWAMVKWLDKPGGPWIASFFNPRSRGEDAGDPR